MATKTKSRNRGRSVWPLCRTWGGGAPSVTWALVGVVLCHGIALAAAPRPPSGAAKVDYNRDIRPILSDKCYKCHGPDEKSREAGLRLDSFESATAELKSGGHAIVAGNIAASELAKRVGSSDSSYRMPPPKSGKTLSEHEIELLKRWIEQGAKFTKHWSLIPPQRPELPAVAGIAGATNGASGDNSWCRNEIDRFIMARLEEQNATIQRDSTPAPGGISERDDFSRPTAGEAAGRYSPAGGNAPGSQLAGEAGGRYAPTAAVERVARVLKASPEADRRTLIRRLSLDLTGIPPAPAEVAAFVTDESPGAYEKLVERLLASPRYGERMALEWLDAARYGDTNGYHIDNERQNWRWRDWVIDAYNRNMPFDQFTIEQIAGDLLPGATLEQKMATGFHRNHIVNFEGGAIEEEYLSAYLVDRVNTTGTVWLGMTVNCAQCHDHKFDPVTQEEYYRLYAFFNSIDEKGLDGAKSNPVPSMAAPLAAQRVRFDELTARLKKISDELSGPLPELDARQSHWESEVSAVDVAQWAVLDPFSAVSTGGTTLTKQPDGSLLAEGPRPANEDYEIVAFSQKSEIAAFRLEALADKRAAGGGPGRAEHANFVLSEFEAEAAPLSDPTRVEKIKFVAAHADHSQKNFHVSRAIDGDPATGWAVADPVMAKAGVDRVAVFVADRPFGFPGGTALKIRLRFQSKYKDHSLARVHLAACVDPAISPAVRPCTLGAWYVSPPFAGEKAPDVFAAVYEPETAVDLHAKCTCGQPIWKSRPDFVDGKPHDFDKADNAAIYLYRTIDAPTARRMTVALGSDDAVKMWVNGKLVHGNYVPRPLEPESDVVSFDLEHGRNTLLLKIVNIAGGFGFYFDRRGDDALDPPLHVARALGVPPADRDERHKTLVREYFRSRHWDRWPELKKQVDAAQADADKLNAEIPQTMVMSELPTPRRTFVLTRGQYDKPTTEVGPGVPKCLPPLPDGVKADRLSLARWLVDPGNPLTARVTVNRLWQMLFGIGIVRTAEDFGSQGEWPSHPELLDWLATEFVQSGWDVRHVVRLMVTSATYRQSARVTPEMLDIDPENRLCARAARPRLSAEGLRDNALAIGGLLVERLGGPSVKIYQPPGLWEEISLDPTGKDYTAQVFKADQGDALYRRSLYVFVKRSVPPPTMALFDAPSREFCVVRRSRTNTPLQSLAMMNDPVYVEAARAFGQRLIQAGGATPQSRIARAFEWALARPPKPEEVRVLLDLYAQQRAAFDADEKSAIAFVSVGDSKRDENIDVRELAAWTAVASAVLNLDETITRG